MSECGSDGDNTTVMEPVVEESQGGCGCGCNGGQKDKGIPTGKDDLGLKASPASRGRGQGRGRGRGGSGGR